jgi:hypothetical protein
LNNLIFDVMLKMGDGGGIYTVDNQGDSDVTSTYEAGTLIRGNVIHDTDSTTRVRVGPGGFMGEPVDIALYTEYASRWITMEANVVYNTRHSAGGPSSPGPGQIQDLQYLYNFWVDDGPWWAFGWPALNVREEGNTKLPREGSEAACRAIPACASILSGAGLEPSYRHLVAVTEALN